ncbi:hypothetical protein QBC38DRAFT_392594 [Podospora fimiseda]|uniref:DUF6594 domain-containing protein n=1 Tax=Podospora fimiseda TaxID=252190 RepID=A0AAN7BNA2_9PEZI|nr:hypothetical protein QBC38DRAFT_392594 [Podospora fimiseda]
MQNNVNGNPNPEPGKEEIIRKPWKYIGYKGYANFVSSDDDFFILRRFDALNARIALRLQDQVSLLEEELVELDKKYSDRNFRDLNNGGFRRDQEDRFKKLEEICLKLSQYNDFLLQQSHLRQLPKAPSRDIQSVRNWHYNHDYKAISPEEQRYLEYDKDLISVAVQEKSPLRQLIDNTPFLRTLPLWKHREEDVPIYDAGHLSYYSEKRKDAFSSGVIVLIGAVVLIVPIWTLQALETLQSKLAVITAFILILLAVVSLTMATRPYEAWAIAAAYAAVLMVFVQVGESNS